jgi:Short C-terminal domain
MAISTKSTPFPYVKDELSTKFESVILSALEDNKRFIKLKEFKKVVDSYKEAEKNPDLIYTNIANKMSKELLSYIEPYYKDSLVKDIGIKTQFREGTALLNCDAEFTPIPAYIEVVKKMHGDEVYSIKFNFEMRTKTCMNKVRISSNQNGRFIEIGDMGIDIKVILLQIIIHYFRTSESNVSFKGPLTLINKSLKIQNLSLPISQFQQPLQSQHTDVHATSNNDNPTISIADELVKLAKLKEQGVITESEFLQMKQDLIRRK